MYYQNKKQEVVNMLYVRYQEPNGLEILVPIHDEKIRWLQKA